MNNTDIFALAKCQYCGNQHDGICHLIKSIEFFENGLVKKVEFKDSEGSGGLAPVEAIPVFDFGTLGDVSPDGHNLY